MALRSSLSSLRSQPAAPTPEPADILPADDDIPFDAPDAAAPAQEAAAAATPARGRGRPAGAKDTAPRAPRKSVKAQVEAAVGLSARELRQALKDVESEAATVKDAIATATAKFQPKIDALRAKHAELSKLLGELMFK